MCQKKPSFRKGWGIVMPCLMIIIFIYSILNLEPPIYGIHSYPSTYLTIMWILIAIGLVQITFWIVYPVIKNLKSQESFPNYKRIKSAFAKGFSPSDNWGPADQQLREIWLSHRMENKEKRQDTRKIPIILGLNEKLIFY
jgi:hypothetical protein